MVVEEPLDVGHDGVHHGLHGLTGPQALSLRLSLDALGQGTDLADLHEQRPVPLVEGRHAVDSLSWDFKQDYISLALAITPIGYKNTY